MLTGYTCDKMGNPVPGTIVELKDEYFQTVSSAISDENGYYTLKAEEKIYPYLVAVKSYAQENLEYWCQNVDLRQNLQLNPHFDKLEVYGLHPFVVRGGSSPFMAYFRPMSLIKFLGGEADIAPEIAQIDAKLDGHPAKVLHINPVKEINGGEELTAYLVQLETSEINWKRLDVAVWDTENNFGEATVFNH